LADTLLGFAPGFGDHSVVFAVGGVDGGLALLLGAIDFIKAVFDFRGWVDVAELHLIDMDSHV
jgi:hypothetical protein